MQKLDKNIVIISTLMTTLAWLYVVFSYNNLPSKIVGHMDLEGKITRLDDKSTIWVLPIIFTSLQILIYWFSKKIKFKKNKLKNESAQKTVSLFMLPYIAVILLVVEILIIEKSNNPTLDLSYLLVVIVSFTILFLILLFSFIYKNLNT